MTGLGIGVLISVLLGAWLFHTEDDSLRMQHRQRIVLMHGNGLALAIANTSEQEAASRIARISSLDPRIESAILVGGMQMLASTRPEDQAPRRLRPEEKPLFDLSNRLRAARETNFSEQVVRKQTIQVDEKPAGHFTVTVPWLRDGQFAGIVQMKFNATGVDAAQMEPVSLAVPAVIVLAALLAGALIRIKSAKKIDVAKFAAVGIFLAIVFYYQHYQLQRVRQALAQDSQVVAADYLSTASQYDRLGILALAHDTTSPNLWDTDHYQRPLGLIAASGDVLPDAQAARFDERSRLLSRILAVFDVLGLAALLAFVYGYAARFMAALKDHSYAYGYVAPAMFGMLVLVFFPFLYGIALSFTDTTLFNEFQPFQDRLIGWANFWNILGDFHIYEHTGAGIIWNYQNFYWTLMVTIAWTLCNVTIGVSVGFLLAMALNTEGLRGKAIYRVILILPWAIPNYITALIWRGMFHPQFGVINQVLQMFGMQPVAWFDGVVSSFLTGVATNGWLSFPFMMVVILGALQSIPRDMYEAAEVEGATRWQRLRFITLPLLRPTLVPAIVLSVVWTFNMFNIIFLVSGGEPGGANEILITKAYKIAFENYQYAYAAAYSTVIFVILLMYGIFQTKITRATESF